MAKRFKGSGVWGMGAGIWGLRFRVSGKGSPVRAISSMSHEGPPQRYALEGNVLEITDSNLPFPRCPFVKRSNLQSA